MRVEKNNIDRKVFSLKDFRGVDYASSPLEVKPYRATDMANLLLRDGQLQKRYGFKQKMRLPFKNGEIPDQFEYRMFQPPKNDYLLAQMHWRGEKSSEMVNRFVAYKNSSGIYTEEASHNIANGEIATAVSIGEKMYMFMGLGDIYYFDGNIIKGDVVRVVHSAGKSNYYIPTTTINIPPYAEFNDEGDRIRADTSIKFPYTSNESANMLTNKVKNKLLCNVEFINNTGINWYTTPPWFRLDGNIGEPAANTTVMPRILVRVENEDGEVVEQEYGKFSVELVNNVSIAYPGDMPGATPKYCYFNGTAGVAIFHDPSLVLKHSISSQIPQRSVLAIASKLDPDQLNIDKTNFVKMLNDIADKGDGTDNKEFIVEYINTNIGNNSKVITTCSLSTIYGVEGANDRLFVGGSKAGGANIVYFSENDASFKPNPMYFPVDNFLVCGTSDAPISGFLRATDGRLAILKDVTNTEDVAVYYTSGHYVEHVDEEIGTTYQEARFTVQAGDIQRRGISARAVVNLDGDHMFASEEGVYGIVLSNNVASAERYARERSRTINPKITKLGLKNSKGIVYNDKYFLAVDNGEVYVADARYKFTLQGDQQNTYNYEWFRLTGLWVKEWFILDGKLFFIDKDGYICEFVENSFTDQYLVRKTDNELMVEVSTDTEGKKSGSVTFINTRCDLIKASSYAVDHKGRKWEIDIIDEDAGALEIAIPDDIITDTDIKDAMDLDLWFCVPISAYWQSAVMDLNQHMYLKNMWSLSMVVSSKHGGKINLGYKTRLNAVSNIEVEGANDFAWGDDIDMFGGTQTSMLTGKSESFGMYTFDVGGYVGINTYRRRLFERNFAHIQLLFTSETATDCAVAEMDIEYSIARKNIGVG